MKQHNHKRLVCVFALVCVLLSFGLTAYAAEPETPAAPLPPYAADMIDELYPADVQTVISDEARQIVKTYILTAGQSPADIPRDGFIRDGWLYTLTDITEKRTSGTDKQSHTETVEINTDTNNLNDILKLLTPTLDYQSADGYGGNLTLDMASVKCEAAGYKNSSYTVTATREYPHLSTNDLSLIPKTITDNGKTLTLDDVTWEVQRYTNIDYYDIPESYRAVAVYTAKAFKSVVTGYITTAEYTGEITKTVTGDTVYIAYFEGSEINPAPMPTPEPTPTPATPSTVTPTDPPAPVTQSGNSPHMPLLIGFVAVVAFVAGAGAYWLFLRHNVKVSRVKDGRRALVAKDRISVKNLTIDLSPLEYTCFDIEIDKYAAKTLNGRTLTIRHGNISLNHKIAYEGNVYTIEVDFEAGTIQAVY